MIGDVLGDACRLQPLLEWCLCHVILETGEYKPLSCVAVYQSQCLVPDGIVDNLFCLLHTGSDIERSVGFGLYHFPCEWLDIALPQPCKA